MTKKQQRGTTQKQASNREQTCIAKIFKDTDPNGPKLQRPSSNVAPGDRAAWAKRESVIHHGNHYKKNPSAPLSNWGPLRCPAPFKRSYRRYRQRQKEDK